MISPHKIKFQKIFSNELNIPDLIMCCAFDNDSSEVSTYLNREAVSVESYDGRRNNTTTYKYSERFSPRFTFLKKGFGDFEVSEVRAVLKWLTSSDTPALLDVYYDESNVVEWSAIGNWTGIDSYKLANNRTVGIVATFEAITPYAMSDLYTVTKTISTPISTTMYCWKTTSASGATLPQYFLTYKNTLSVEDKLYTFTGAASAVISKDTISLYGTISEKNGATYAVNGATFTASTPTSVTVQDMNNKIIINIDTDDNKPVYPRIIINHGYGAVTTPHYIVSLPSNVVFNSIVDMADYVENTVYYNSTTNTYYYKAYTPTFTSSATLPQYVNWTTVEVDEEYTETSQMAANTFYHYAYEGVYYWIADGKFYAEPSRPVYGDWKTKAGTKVYTAIDSFEDKTIYSYNNKYYWMAPHSFYKSSVAPNLSTTSVKITNKHYDFFNQPSVPVVTIVKNNTGTEKIVLDGANKIVSSDRVRRIFGDDFNLQHLELYDGKNEITIEGNCEVTLEWREVRKIGEY